MLYEYLERLKKLDAEGINNSLLFPIKLNNYNARRNELVDLIISQKLEEKQEDIDDYLYNLYSESFNEIQEKLKKDFGCNLQEDPEYYLLKIGKLKLSEDQLKEVNPEFVDSDGCVYTELFPVDVSESKRIQETFRLRMIDRIFGLRPMRVDFIAYDYKTLLLTSPDKNEAEIIETEKKRNIKYKLTRKFIKDHIGAPESFEIGFSHVYAGYNQRYEDIKNYANNYSGLGKKNYIKHIKSIPEILFPVLFEIINKNYGIDYIKNLTKDIPDEKELIEIYNFCIDELGYDNLGIKNIYPKRNLLDNYNQLVLDKKIKHDEKIREHVIILEDYVNEIMDKKMKPHAVLTLIKNEDPSFMFNMTKILDSCNIDYLISERNMDWNLRMKLTVDYYNKNPPLEFLDKERFIEVCRYKPISELKYRTIDEIIGVKKYNLELPELNYADKIDLKDIESALEYSMKKDDISTFSVRYHLKKINKKYDFINIEKITFEVAQVFLFEKGYFLNDGWFKKNTKN